MMRRILCIAQGFRELADPRKSAADEKTHQDNASYRRAMVRNQAAALFLLLLLAGAMIFTKGLILNGNILLP